MALDVPSGEVPIVHVVVVREATVVVVELHVNGVECHGIDNTRSTLGGAPVLQDNYEPSEVGIRERSLRRTRDIVLLAAGIHESAQGGHEGREVLGRSTLDIQVDTVMRR